MCDLHPYMMLKRGAFFCSLSQFVDKMWNTSLLYLVCSCCCAIAAMAAVIIN